MLKQLMLSKKIEQRKAALAALLEQETALSARGEELEAALGEAKTDEEIGAVEEEVNKLEADKTEMGNKKGKLEGEIAELEGELAKLNSKEPESTKRGTEGREGGMNRIYTRELLRTGEYYERAEVKEFYDNFKNLRAVTGGELTIPDVVVNRIMDIMGDYTTLYPLVDKIQVKGTTRILVDTDTTPATWIEQAGTLSAGDVGTIVAIDFDGFKVGKVTFVDNYLLQDSIVNLDAYVTKKIARAIAKALDKAIVSGEGATKKQPLGIVTRLNDALADPDLSATHVVSVEADADLIKNLVKQIGLIDTGEDAVGEVTVVMHRTTYYNRLVEFSIQVDSDGNVVGKLPNLKTPDLLGLPVVFNNYLDTDTVLFGEFQQYTLVERENITIDASEHVKFLEDQMAFRGKGRFDGKPVKPEAFVLVTITEPVAG